MMMVRRIHRPLIVLIALLCAATAALPTGAQTAVGDAVFSGSKPSMIDVAGVYSTLAPFAAPSQVTAIAPAPNNDGFLVAINPFPGAPAIAEWKNGTLGKALYQTWHIPTVWEMFADPYGKTVVVGTTNFGQTGFGDLEPGSFTLTYEAPTRHPSNAAPLRSCLDPVTDQVLCVTATGELLHIEREDPIVITTLAASSKFAYPGGVHPHPRADKLIVAGLRGDFWIVDRFSGAKALLYDAPASVESMVDWDVDPVRNAIVAYRHENTNERSLVRIDLGSGALTSVWSSTTGGPADTRMALYGSQLLTYAGGTPKVGEVYALRVFAPGLGGEQYLIGASRGAIPGFTWLGRHLAINIDDVLIDSLTKPTTYANFSGVLDGSGSAYAGVLVPAALAGQRIHFAVVIIVNGFVKAVSLPFGVTIAPAS